MDDAFHVIIDGSSEKFMAEAAQAAKEVVDDLDHILKSKLRHCSIMMHS
jgi:hypothetical protein